MYSEQPNEKQESVQTAESQTDHKKEFKLIDWDKLNQEQKIQLSFLIHIAVIGFFLAFVFWQLGVIFAKKSLAVISVIILIITLILLIKRIKKLKKVLA